jgi:glycosyltransferase involved in cell wall biosynthesis
MNVLHLMSCRGWSSDAYWAASVCAALERTGHRATLVCKRGSDARVIDRAREAGVERIATLAFASGVHPTTDAGDVRRLASWLPGADVVHVHRGKEHWLAAVANRLSATPRPVVRTRHIVQVVRPHALNRWLYARATGLVVTVTEAIRRQYIAAGLVAPDRVLTLPGGVSLDRFHRELDGARFRLRIGIADDVPLLGLVAGLRVMKGHGVAIEAARRLAASGRRFHAVFIGDGKVEPAIRRAIAEAGLEKRITVAGFVPDLPAAIAAFDVALYTALESEGMSRVVFEYLAMGKPVVATRVGVVPEVLEDQETALLVPAAEVDPLVAALGRMLDEPALRTRLGAAAADLAHARLSSARIARALGDRYARLCGEGPSPAPIWPTTPRAGRFSWRGCSNRSATWRSSAPASARRRGPPSRAPTCASARCRGGSSPPSTCRWRGWSRWPTGMCSTRPSRGWRAPGWAISARSARAGRCCSTWTTGKSGSSCAAASGARWGAASTTRTPRACRGPG